MTRAGIGIVMRLKISIATIILLAAAGIAHAGEIQVGGDCDLASAIRAATYNSAFGGCKGGHGADIIKLTRNEKPGGELPEINTDITINGQGHQVFIDRRNHAFKVVEGGSLTLVNLRVTYTSHRWSEAIHVEEGRLRIIDSSIHHCRDGVIQERGHTSLIGRWDICGLRDRDIVVGSHSVDFDPRPLDTCGDLPAGSLTVTASAPGMDCKRVDANGVGNSAVINAGLIDAVDIFGNVQAGAQVCFAPVGAVMFLDAATSPRAVSTLESTRMLNDRTCATIGGAGTVALVHGQPTHVEPDPEEPQVCTIETTGHLKLRGRASLSGDVLAYVPRGSQLERLGQWQNWHQAAYAGQTGWLGGKYVRVVGGC